MDSPLTLHVTSEANTTVVQAVGEVDMATSAQLRDCLLAAVQDGSPVHIDFSQVSLLDSTGVMALLRAHRMAEADEVTVVVTAVSPQVDKVLRLAGVAKTFGLPDT